MVLAPCFQEWFSDWHVWLMHVHNSQQILGGDLGIVTHVLLERMLCDSCQLVPRMFFCQSSRCIAFGRARVRMACSRDWALLGGKEANQPGCFFSNMPLTAVLAEKFGQTHLQAVGRSVQQGFVGGSHRFLCLQWEKRFVRPIGITIFSAGICWLCSVHRVMRGQFCQCYQPLALASLQCPTRWLILVFRSESQEVWCQHISPTRINLHFDHRVDTLPQTRWFCFQTRVTINHDHTSTQSDIIKTCFIYILRLFLPQNT